MQVPRVSNIIERLDDVLNTLLRIGYKQELLRDVELPAAVTVNLRR